MLLKVAISTGETLSFELPAEIGLWDAKQGDLRFQRSIRSMSLVHAGRQHVLPAPAAFRRVTYMAESKVKENGTPASSRVGVVVDDVTAWLTVYHRDSPPMCRFDLRHTGRLVWQSR